MMKRGGAEVAPAHLERVRQTLQWGGSRRHQALGQGGRALPCLVKMFQHQRHTYCLQQVLSRPLGAAQSALLRGASLWAAGCGMHVNWPCGGVRLREMRVEGHGSPMSSIKCVLLLCRFRSCDSSAAIPERSPTPLYYPLPPFRRFEPPFRAIF